MIQVNRGRPARAHAVPASYSCDASSHPYDASSSSFDTASHPCDASSYSCDAASYSCDAFKDQICNIFSDAPSDKSVFWDNQLGSTLKKSVFSLVSEFKF